MIHRANSQLQCKKTGGNEGEPHNGEAWELIMQILQLQRNNNSGNSYTSCNVEGYCLPFAYLLENYNLHIMPILFRTMSLCSYNNAQMRSCHAASFQFKQQLCCQSWRSKSARFETISAIQCRKVWENIFIKQDNPMLCLYSEQYIQMRIKNKCDPHYTLLIGPFKMSQANKSWFYSIAIWLFISMFPYRYWCYICHCYFYQNICLHCWGSNTGFMLRLAIR